MNIATVLHDGGHVRAVQTGSRLKVEAGHDDRVTVTATRTDTIRVSTPGPQGPVGPVADLDLVLSFVDVAVEDYFVLHPQTFTYSTDVPADTWTILHPLTHRPTATVTDTAGEEIDLEQSWPAPNLLRLDSNQTLPGIRATLT